MPTAVRSLLVLEMAMTSATESYTTVRSFDVVDIIIQPTATDATPGTVEVRNAGVAISSSLACAVIGTVARTTTVAAATRVIATGATVTAVATSAGTAARGIVYVTVCPDPL